MCVYVGATEEDMTELVDYKQSCAVSIVLCSNSLPCCSLAIRKWLPLNIGDLNKVVMYLRRSSSSLIVRPMLFTKCMQILCMWEAYIICATVKSIWNYARSTSEMRRCSGCVVFCVHFSRSIHSSHPGTCTCVFGFEGDSGCRTDIETGKQVIKLSTVHEHMFDCAMDNRPNQTKKLCRIRIEQYALFREIYHLN